jgi:hypothetical protein
MKSGVGAGNVEKILQAAAAVCNQRSLDKNSLNLRPFVRYVVLTRIRKPTIFFNTPETSSSKMHPLS